MKLLASDALLQSCMTTGPIWAASSVTNEQFAPIAVRPSVDISPGRSIKRHTAEWSGASAEVIRVTHHAPITMHFQAPAHLLIGYMHGARRDGETVVGATHRSTVKDTAKKFTFVPAGYEYRESFDPRALPEIALFYLDADCTAIDPQSGQTMAPLVPRLHFADPVLWETMSKLCATVEESGNEDRPYLAAIGAVLAHELRRLGRGIRAADAPARGGLAAWQQRVALEYIEENVADEISLAQLSEMVRLSPHHFCRAFRQSIGQPPGRYHGHRRIARAKALLGSSMQSVTEIGLSLGYSETSSFTAAFRRATGITPTAFRRRMS